MSRFKKLFLFLLMSLVVVVILMGVTVLSMFIYEITVAKW